MVTIKEKAWIKPISLQCHAGLFLFSKEVPPVSACHETLLFYIIFKFVTIPACCHLLSTYQAKL